MKTKSNAVLMVLALLVYFSGLRTVSAFYDPGAQRWLNRDPIQELGGINLYSYVKNIPYNLDLFGLDEFSDYGVTQGMLNMAASGSGFVADMAAMQRIAREDAANNKPNVPSVPSSSGCPHSNGDNGSGDNPSGNPDNKLTPYNVASSLASAGGIGAAGAENNNRIGSSIANMFKGSLADVKGVAGSLGSSIGIAGIGIDILGLLNNDISPTEAIANTGATLYSMTGPVGAAFGGGYAFGSLANTWVPGVSSSAQYLIGKAF